MRPLPFRLALAAVLAAWSAIPLGAQFGQNKVTYHNFDWQVYESPHFDIHYYPEMEPFLEEVVSYIESAYLELSKELDHELRFRVPLIVYKTHGEFQQTNISLTELPEGVAAFAEPVQNRMVLPIDLPPDQLYALMAHELTHIFQYSMFFEGYLGRALRSSVPAWLMEGMASYFAKDENNIDRMAIRDAVVNNILPPIQALDVVTFLTYRYGHAIFDYIEQEHGKEGVRNFLFEYRKVLLTNNIEKAIKEAFGYDVETFNRRFNTYLRKKYFPVLLEKKSPDDYGTEIGVKKPGVFTFSPTVSPSGELVAALASAKLELDLMVFSADDGEKVRNLTKGFTTDYRYLIAEAFAAKRDLSWSPVADQVAVFARRERHTPLLVYDTLKRKKVHDIVFDDIVQCASPAFSPDGKRVAFEGNRLGVVDIFEVDLASGAVRNLTQDDFFDSNPWYSPDGEQLLYNRRIGAHWKIFSVDLSDPAKKTQLTVGASSDVQPAYSRDGRTIYFASDRNPYGVFNIYAMDLGSGDVTQYTDVVGGCFAPVELAGRDGERHLAFQAFFEGTFRLYRMPLGEPEATTTAAAPPEALEAEPFEPPLTLRVDDAMRHPYKLKWDVEAPAIAVGVTDDGTFLSNIGVQFSDLLGNHRVQLLASTVSDFAAYQGQYLNFKRRYIWGATIFDFRDFFLRDTGVQVERDQETRTTGANAFLQYPISRYYRVQTTVGVLDNEQAFATTDPLTGLIDFQDRGDTFATVGATLTGDTTRFQSFGPFQGRRFSIGTLWGYHLSGDFEGDILEHRLDFRSYKQLTRRSLFAFRLASIYNAKERENSYGFGGLNQLRGFGFRDYAGSRLGWMNIELRFPLVEELRLPVLELGQIRGFLFFDVGAAWFRDDLWFDPESGIIRQEFLAGPTPGTFLARPVEFDFWDSDADRLQDGRAAYGWGFQFLFIGGLQFNWVWANPLEYTQFKYPNNCVVGITDCLLRPVAVDPSTRSEFYIAFDF